MKLRLQQKDKKHTIEVSDDATIANLLDVIGSTINAPKFTIKVGFPPKSIDLGVPTTTLRHAKIRSGESIIVEVADGASDSQKSQATSSTSLRPKNVEAQDGSIKSAPTANVRRREVLQDSFSFGGAPFSQNTHNDESSPPEIEIPGRG